MSDVVAVALISSSATLLGGFGLSLLAHLLEGRRTTRNARRERLMLTRIPAAEFVTEARGYFTEFDVLSTELREVGREEPGAYFNTYMSGPGGARIAEHRRKMDRALADLVTLIEDPEFTAAVEEFQAQREHYLDEVLEWLRRGGRRDASRATISLPRRSQRTLQIAERIHMTVRRLIQTA